MTYFKKNYTEREISVFGDVLEARRLFLNHPAVIYGDNYSYNYCLAVIYGDNYGYNYCLLGLDKNENTHPAFNFKDWLTVLEFGSLDGERKGASL